MCVKREKEGFPGCVCVCVSGWVVGFLCVCVCVQVVLSKGSPPPLVSASAVSLTHPTANQITARGEERMMGEAMLGMVLTCSDGRRCLCVYVQNAYVNVTFTCVCYKCV